MSGMLLNREQPAKKEEEKPDGQIALFFWKDGRQTWRIEGDVQPGSAVNLLELCSLMLKQGQLTRMVQATAKQMQSRVCMPDGSIPIR